MAESKEDSAAPAARMAMKQMVLENFKSYAGKRVIGPFHKSFSSIVGPNGSGKSNVIDALLFVFGRRATSMRLKKIAELIHSSTHHKNLPYCRVAVHFHDIVDDDEAPQGFRVVPGSDLEIARTADRDGKSKYFVNGRASNFKEVTSLLRAKGVDLDNNRFLILQGEVEQISLMKPKAQQEGDSGLLEYLEDIIGTNVYVAEIEKKALLVEQLNDQRQEKLHRVKIVEKEKSTLEGAKTEAEEYLAKRGEIDVLYAHRYQHFEWLHQQNAGKASAAAEEASERLEHEKAKLSTGDEELRELEESHARAKAEVEEVVAAQEAAHAEYAVFERSDAQAGEDLKHYKGAASKAQAALKRHAKKAAQLEKALAEASGEEEAKLEKRAAKLAERRDAGEARLEELYEGVKAKTEPIRLRLEARQKDLIPLQGDVNAAQQELDAARNELGLYAGKAEAAERRVADAAREADEAREGASRSAADLKAAAKAAREGARRLPKARAELEQAGAREKELAGVRQQLASSTEEARAALAAQESRGKALRAIMKEAAKGKKGSLGGRVFGRLGELGSVDRKYDVAVSTAVSQLRNIVVENAVVGQRCCDFLRRHQLGRATFTILDKLSHVRARMEDEVATPDNAPRLYDLVTIKDEAFAPAFYQAMAGTLVARDLDHAVKVANLGGRRWRVVTLQGQLIDSSGTMSGGGNKVQRGAMRLGARGGGKASSASSADAERVATPEEVAVLEQRLKATERELAQARERRRALEREIVALEKVAAEAEVQQRKLEMLVENAATQVADAERRLAEARAEASPSEEDEAAVGELRVREKAAEKGLAKAQRASKKVEVSIEALQQEILDAGGAEVRAQKAAVEQLSADVDKTRKALTKLGVDRANNEKKLAKLAATVEKTEAELADATEKYEALSAEREEKTKMALTVRKSYLRAEKEVKAKKAAMEEVVKAHDDAKQRVNVVRKVLVNLQDRLEEQKALARVETRKAADQRKRLESKKKDVERTRKQLAGIDDDEDDEEDDDEDAEEEKGGAAAMAVDEEAKGDAEDGDEEETKGGDDDDAKMDGDDDDEAGAAKKGKSKKNKRGASVLEYEELSEDEVAAFNHEESETEITILEQALQDMNPNMAAIDEYREKNREYLVRVEQLDKITQERDRERKVYEALRKKRLDEFMAAFTVITMKLKEMYQMLTLGGDAELELVDSIDPFSEGIVFSVRPPKKSWKNIQNLSGGEKTLSSLALVFALHHFKPTPLYVMDEIDAALDFKNVSIVANYIKERTKNAQFVIISLRNNMFELADRLVGIYKTHDVTKSITIDPQQFSMPMPGAQAAPAAAAPAPAGAAASQTAR